MKIMKYVAGYDAGFGPQASGRRAKLFARLHRNLLPCVGEARAG